MYRNVFDRFVSFVKVSLGEKFKAFIPGVCMGFYGSQHIFWNGEIASTIVYILKSIMTVLMAGGSGLAPSYAALIVEDYKIRRNEKAAQKKSPKRSKAA